MKIKALLYIFAVILIGCKENTVNISGNLLNSTTGEYIYIDKLDSDELITVDSTMISENGTFSFKIDIKTPSFYLLKKNNSNFLTMLLEPGEKIEINAHYDSLNYPVSLSGSKGTELMTIYNQKLKVTIDKLKELSNIYSQNIDNPELPSIMESLDSMAISYLDEINSYTKEYIDENLSSLASLVALYQQVAPNVYVMNPMKDLKYFKKVDSSLSKLYPDYEPVISLHSQIEELIANNEISDFEGIIEGELTGAPEIALPNPDGDTIRLSSTRGSFVLLDFWASWCAPCRKENPNLVRIYDMYHNKGFQIYQVSLDKTREAWVKGIKDDNLGKWIHVSDIKYWNSQVVSLYKIDAIPTNFLLDKEGRIIASNLRGENLQLKLAELFGE